MQPQSASSTPSGRARLARHGAAAAAALFSLAVIADVGLESVRSPVEQASPAVTLDAAAVVGILNSAFTPDGVRNKARYPMEFETVLGPTTLSSFDLFASAAWPSHDAVGVLASAGDRSAADGRVADGKVAITRPNARLASATRACAYQACRVHVTSANPAAILPPARPILALPVAIAEARPLPTRVAFVDERRVRLLGVTLPGFVPTGDTIVKTVVSWGGTVADIIPRI